MFHIKYAKRLQILPVIMVLVLSMPHISFANEPASIARNFIQSMADEVISYIGDPALSKNEKKTKLETVLNSNFDMYTISRFTLGPYWKSFTKAQQQEYQALYENMIVSIYAGKFSNYQGEVFIVNAAIPANQSDFIVQSFITKPGVRDIPVNWHVRLKNGEYRIVDVAIENVSMIITQKSDFASTIQRQGGNPVIILDYLREKINQAS